MQLALIFIAHDLAVVNHVSDEIAVMYLGEIVEQGYAKDICRSPKHPYTKALISAIPVPDPTEKSDRIILKGDVPSPVNPPGGCRFHTRCSQSQADCMNRVPVRESVGSGFVACHYWADA